MTSVIICVPSTPMLTTFLYVIWQTTTPKEVSYSPKVATESFLNCLQFHWFMQWCFFCNLLLWFSWLLLFWLSQLQASHPFHVSIDKTFYSHLCSVHVGNTSYPYLYSFITYISKLWNTLLSTIFSASFNLNWKGSISVILGSTVVFFKPKLFHFHRRLPPLPIFFFISLKLSVFIGKQK